jgi:hypothetical protein
LVKAAAPIRKVLPLHLHDYFRQVVHQADCKVIRNHLMWPVQGEQTIELGLQPRDLELATITHGGKKIVDNILERGRDAFSVGKPSSYIVTQHLPSFCRGRGAVFPVDVGEVEESSFLPFDDQPEFLGVVADGDRFTCLPDGIRKQPGKLRLARWTEEFVEKTHAGASRSHDPVTPTPPFAQQVPAQLLIPPPARITKKSVMEPLKEAKP